MEYRIGIGYDSHSFVKDRPLILGGVVIPYELGLLGHSDGDVVIHSLIDALFGASKLPNIGQAFPDDDPLYKDVSSLSLLDKAMKLVAKSGFSVVNADCAVILEEPRISSYLDKMELNIANLLRVDSERINIKPKTNERMGFVGRKEGVICISVVLLKKFAKSSLL